MRPTYTNCGDSSDTLILLCGDSLAGAPETGYFLLISICWQFEGRENPCSAPKIREFLLIYQLGIRNSVESSPDYWAASNIFRSPISFTETGVFSSRAAR